MKKWIWFAAILFFAAALFWMLRTKPAAGKNFPAPENKTSPTSALSNALARQDPKTVAAIESNFARVVTVPAHADTADAIAVPPAGLAQPLEFTNFAPATVVENVRHAIRQYGDTFGGNPVGDNVEIARQLGGENPKHLNFLNPEAGLRLNASGELVDAWGTPFFFHQLSRTEMEIHSAGPDKVMWTYDDVVTR